jgi:CHASE2 domain-containing sensor protein
MSVASAMYGLGIALTVLGGVVTAVVGLFAMTMWEHFTRREHRRVCAVVIVAAVVFGVGVFLLGWTSPAVP